MKRALVLGCGYAGIRLGARLAESGLEVVGTTRRAERAVKLEEAGVAPLVGELADREVLRKIDRLGPQVVFYLVPPRASGSDPLARVLEATARAPLEAFVYASSTSVYGDRDGEWVDETDEPRPGSDAARARHAAERAIVEAGWHYQTPTRICRVAGIYGPGRTLRRRLERGERGPARGRDAWVNRIHVNDLVTALVAAWSAGAAGRVYNIADDEPHHSSDFAFLAADLHGLPRPDWFDAAHTAGRGGRRRGDGGGKRVRNERLKRDLGVRLEYPSYRVGLPAAVGEERGGRESALSERRRSNRR